LPASMLVLACGVRPRVDVARASGLPVNKGIVVNDTLATEVPVDGCTSGGVQVNPGCRDFDGCGERTRWCQHNDPQYGTSHHGVPCFGARVIKQFLDTYQ